MRFCCAFLIAATLLSSSLAQPVSAAVAPESLEKLSAAFWSWRARYAPFSGDDVNRMERPGGTRDWSRAALEKRLSELQQFESDWKAISPGGWTIPQQVDYRLLGSALARIHWE